MLVHQILDHQVLDRARPHHTALVCGSHRLDYATLNKRANAFAATLRAQSVTDGDRVVLWLDNSVDLVVGLFGTWKAGAIAVPINGGTKAPKVRALVTDCDARVIICPELKRDALTESGGPLPCPALTTPLPIAESDTPPATAIGPDDPALILYTSGSTGTPKGVVHGHRGLVAVMRSIATYLDQRETDVVLSVLPLSFGYGQTQMLPTFIAGGTLVLERSFAFPQAVLQKMQQERVTGFAMVPTIAALLLQNDLTRFDLSPLARLTNAGAGIAPDTLMALRKALPNARIFPMYGQTECIRACYLPPDEVDRRPASIGVAIPGCELTIVDDHGAAVGADVSGELVVRGENVMLGYWKLPAETAAKVKPGATPTERVLLTGDVFKKDADGWLHFVARKDDIIKTRGEKVSPREVENVLHALAGVVEAAIIGVPDPIFGAVIKAFVVPARGVVLDEKAVLRHCASALEDFAVPKRVEFLSEMPKTPNSKIDKQELLTRSTNTG